jgi:hypothetical protein
VRLLGLALLIGCGNSRVPAAPVSDPPASPVRVTAKAADPPKRPLARLATAFDTHQVETVIAGSPEGACDERVPWIVSGRSTGDGPASCAITRDAIHCVASAAGDLAAAEALLCPRSATVSTPPWASALAEFLREQAPAHWEITKVAAPNGIEALRVEILTDDSSSSHALVRTGKRWRASERIGDEMPKTFLRVIDTSRVTGGSSIGLIMETRDGGTEMGEASDSLDLMCEGTDELRACGQIQLGYLSWQLPAEERRKHPNGAHTLRGRPHVEVLLEPQVRFPDRLVLSVVRSTLSTDAETWGAETLATLHALLADAGEWRFVDGKLVRVN